MPVRSIILASITGPSVPSAPTITDTYLGHGTANIIVGVSASNGGSPITSYTVVASNGATQTTTNVSSPTVTFTGLTIGAYYTFYAYATNAAGNSPNSAASASKRMLTNTSIPSSVTGTKQSSTSILFSWPVTDGGGGTITYQCFIQPANTLINTNNTSITYSGLSAGTYSLFVQTTNGTYSSAGGRMSNNVTLP